MTTDKILILARKNLGGTMESSARLCLADAVSLYAEGKFYDAKSRALDSLRYSVGVFHHDYRKAVAR